MKEGSLIEAVTWEISPGKNHQIPQFEISYLLHKHFRISNDEMKFIGDQLDPLIQRNTNKSSLQLNLDLIEEYDRLVDKLQQLTTVPLAIENIHRNHPSLSYLSAIIPEAHPLLGRKLAKQSSISLYAEPINLLLEFEESRRWPDNVEAIRALKTAFYVRISHELKSSHHLESVLSRDHLDVISSGFVFRIKIRLTS
jgi:U3 small nucleolar RNA-associated protein 22